MTPENQPKPGLTMSDGLKAAMATELAKPQYKDLRIPEAHDLAAKTLLKNSPQLFTSSGDQVIKLLLESD